MFYKIEQGAFIDINVLIEKPHISEVYVQGAGLLIPWIRHDHVVSTPGFEGLELVESGYTKLDNGWEPAWAKFLCQTGWAPPPRFKVSQREYTIWPDK